jgi:hypothetical protein
LYLAAAGTLGSSANSPPPSEEQIVAVVRLGVAATSAVERVRRVRDQSALRRATDPSSTRVRSLCAQVGGQTATRCSRWRQQDISHRIEAGVLAEHHFPPGIATTRPRRRRSPGPSVARRFGMPARGPAPIRLRGGLCTYRVARDRRVSQSACHVANEPVDHARGGIKSVTRQAHVRESV